MALLQKLAFMFKEFLFPQGIKRGIFLRHASCYHKNKA